MNVVLVVLGGLVLGAIAGALLNNGACCTVVAQAIRGEAPAWLQSAGDTVNLWPITIGLANLGS